jgi:hypothetical protein
MIKVTLDPNWKENVENSVIEKYAAVEVVGGQVKAVHVNHVDLVEVKVFLINHDLLRNEIPRELQKLGLGFNQKAYDVVVEVMKTTGEDDVEAVVKSIFKR